MSQAELHLKLTVADMIPAHQKNKDSLASPRFFHFSEKIKPIEFHNATLITFTRPDGSEHVIKDLYGRLQKKADANAG